MSTQTGLGITIASDSFPEVLEALRNPENSDLDPYTFFTLIHIGLADEEAMRFAREFRLKEVDGKPVSMDKSTLIKAIRLPKVTVDELIELEYDYLDGFDAELEKIKRRNVYLDARCKGKSHFSAIGAVLKGV